MRTSSAWEASEPKSAKRSRERRESKRVRSCSVTCSGAARPTSFDRVLATRFGAQAVELIRRGQFGVMVAFAPPDIVARPLDDVVGKTKTVPLDSDLLLTAKALGVTFGD